MSSPRSNIPDAVREVQGKASQPEISAFVAANAGSGKTHVLVNRVIRLLLNDVKPEKILCITFTKAAAANMAQKVFEKLGRWVALPDDQLDKEIRDAGESNPNAATRLTARRLFASALETPGGLKVQTIHALCTRLLQQFPFEANVPARFSVLDDRDRDEMMARANLAVLTDAGRDPKGPAARALETAIATAADVTFQDVVREACLSNRHFMAWSDEAGSVDAAMTQTAQALGIGIDEAIEDVERAIVDGPYLPRSEWMAVAAVLATGSKTDASQAETLRDAFRMSGRDQIDSYLGFFMTGSGTARKSLMTKALVKDHPELAGRLDLEQLRALEVNGKRLAIMQRDRTHALLIIANAVASNYRREKQDRGLLDYDDLIAKTLALLTNVSAGWVHFKLDYGIDHVLIDEAQDTSPHQWDIVERLTSEFTTGAGARQNVKRTIFAVGDEKQSIFSFQGAAPREFDLRRNGFERKYKNAQLAFANVSFKHSFRSGRAILQAVDHVFRDENIYSSIHAPENGYPIHEALDDARPALIDLWPLEEPSESDDGTGWDAPLDAMPETSPEARLAQRVQAEIGGLIAARTETGHLNAPRQMSYGDILILVRRRGTAFDAVIQALKQARIPVAGADRLKLTEHIAIIDLMNLADALLLPQDDLALAVALKSPLFDLDDEDLLKIAPLRDGTLRDALALHAEADNELRIAFDRLEACKRRFATETPFAFYAWLLGGDGGRARFLLRLGPEANDALDEFLELALSYEQRAPASLQGFMAWLRAAETEVKRDMEVRRDEVRVMTVHGAKGLEASVVFLIDTTTSPADTLRQNLVRLPQGNAGPNSSGVVVWAGKKGDDIEDVATARAAMKEETEDEYRRLLYVAMTRAADRLIVGGILPGNVKSVRALSWYDLIANGLLRSGLQEHDVLSAHGTAKRYTLAGDVPPAASAIVASAIADVAESPAWLRTAAPSEAASDTLLRPSDPIERESHGVVTAESLAARAKAMQRGTLVHRMLQSLPDVATEQRLQMTLNYLARNASEWIDSERDALAHQVIALIEAETFKPLFAPGSRAEVSIAGLIARRGKPAALVSGQIDRLVVTTDEILIVDYKTNHTPPVSVSDAPQTYVRQLALYRGVLAQLYPERPVRCALLWTETAAMMEIPASALDAELLSIVS